MQNVKVASALNPQPTKIKKSRRAATTAAVPAAHVEIAPPILFPYSPSVGTLESLSESLFPASLRLNFKGFLTGEELTRAELLSLIELAKLLKTQRSKGRSKPLLSGQQVGLYFEKPSLRTRVSFTVAANELGGNAIEIVGSNVKKEEPEDTIRVLGGYLHCLMVRTFEHSTLERMVAKSPIPVINGLSDDHHPCQALADILTVKEHFPILKGVEIAYIGDGNNVLNSLLLLAPMLGMTVRYACPEGYKPNADILARAQKRASENGGKILAFDTPAAAVAGAHAVYTDVWTSMGFEDENEARLKAFQGYQLNEDLMKLAHPSAIAMHCLPMVRGLEISETLADAPCSAIFQQSENRLHVQKALLLGLLPQGF
jgi:ornithine carbamoyltransferase